MSDAPRKWWNRLDATVKAMGSCPARADRCTYVSYPDVKKHKKTRMAHSADTSEDTPSKGDSMPCLDDNACFRMRDEILDQLMEDDEDKKLKVWASNVERRDIHLTAKKTLPSWEKVTMRKTVDVESDKVTQIKYIGDKGWGSMKERIDNDPLRVRTYMMYLNVESDMDAKKRLHHWPGSRILTGRWSMVTSARMLMIWSSRARKTFCRHSQESSWSPFRLARWTRMMPCSAAKESWNRVPLSLCVRICALKTSMKPWFPRARTRILLWVQTSQSTEASSGSWTGCSPEHKLSPLPTMLDTKGLSKVVRLVKDKPQRLRYAPITGVPRFGIPGRTTQTPPLSVASASSSTLFATRRETPRGRLSATSGAR